MATRPDDDRLAALALVNQGHDLLNRFLALDAQQTDRAWEIVVELQALLDHLREIRPPRTFRRKTETS
jgi:hypothetical protein